MRHRESRTWRRHEPDALRTVAPRSVIGARRFSLRRTCPAARSDAARYYRAAVETQGAGRCAGMWHSLFHRSGGEIAADGTRERHRARRQIGTGRTVRQTETPRRTVAALFPAKRGGRGANGCACWRAVARPFRLWRVDRGEIGRGTGHGRRDCPANLSPFRTCPAADRERLRPSPVRQTVRRGVGTVATAGGFRRVVFSGIYKAQGIEKSGKTQTRRNGARWRRLSCPKRQNRP